MDFRTLYNEHVALVWRTVFRLGVPKADLPDAVQEVFLAAHRKLPEFEGRSKASTWLVGIAYRVASDRRRLAHIRREVGNDSAVLAQGDGGPDPEEMAQRGEQFELLDEILASLPTPQREVFVMFELEELSGKEIAAIVDAPIKTIFSRLRLAREGFAAALAKRRATAVEHALASPVAFDVLARKGQAP
jgi:RNA polymerase sigma-70 factor (ECF subfamily)